MTPADAIAICQGPRRAELQETIDAFFDWGGHALAYHPRQVAFAVLVVWLENRKGTVVDGQVDEKDEEDEDLLERAVLKMQNGETLSEAESLELLAENQLGRPLGLAADMPVHKSLTPFNRTRPVESLQETLYEVRDLIRGERESIVLNKVLRGAQRHELVNKSLGIAEKAIFGQRQ